MRWIVSTREMARNTSGSKAEKFSQDDYKPTCVVIVENNPKFLQKYYEFVINHKVIFDYLFKSSYMPV